MNTRLIKRVNKFLCSLLVLAAANLIFVPTASAANQADPSAPGSYAVGYISYLLVDVTRDTDSEFGGRPIPVNVWFPVDPTAITDATPRAEYPLLLIGGVISLPSWVYELEGVNPVYAEQTPAYADGPFPLIVISHALGHVAIAHASHAAHLASHGFIVAATSHFKDGLFRPMDPLEKVLEERPKDVSFMLTNLLNLNTTGGSLLQNTIDPDNIGGIGMSLGGYTMFTLAGGDDDVNGHVALPDERIRSIVTLDGSNQFHYFYELQRITIPTLIMGREYAEAGSFVSRPHSAVSGLPNYRVEIDNSRHAPSFTDFCIIAPIAIQYGLFPPESLAECADPEAISFVEARLLVNKYVLAFLTSELKGDFEFNHLLTPGWAKAKEPAIEFFNNEPAPEQDGYFRFFRHQPGDHPPRNNIEESEMD